MWCSSTRHEEAEPRHAPAQPIPALGPGARPAAGRRHRRGRATGPIVPDPHGGLVLLAGHGLSPDPAGPPGRLGSCRDGGEQHGAVDHQRLRPGSGRRLRLLGRRRPQPDPPQVRRRHGQRGNPGERRRQLSLPHRGGLFLRLLGRHRQRHHQAGPDLRVPHRDHHRRLVGRGVQRRRHRAGRQLPLLGRQRQPVRPGGGHLQPQHRHHPGQRRPQQSRGPGSGPERQLRVRAGPERRQQRRKAGSDLRLPHRDHAGQQHGRHAHGRSRRPDAGSGQRLRLLAGRRRPGGAPGGGRRRYRRLPDPDHLGGRRPHRPGGQPGRRRRLLAGQLQQSSEVDPPPTGRAWSGT